MSNRRDLRYQARLAYAALDAAGRLEDGSPEGGRLVTQGMATLRELAGLEERGGRLRETIAIDGHEMRELDRILGLRERATVTEDDDVDAGGLLGAMGISPDGGSLPEDELRRMREARVEATQRPGGLLEAFGIHPDDV